MKFDGKWVMLRDEEPFDAEHSEVLEIDGGEVRSSRGAVGTVCAEADEIRIDLTPKDRLIFKNTAVATNDMAGVLYSSSIALPPGEPGAIEQDDEDAEPDWWCDSVFLIRQTVAAERFKDGPSRYSTIDVSMYDLDTLRVAGFFDTETDEDVAAVLAKLPLAKVTLREANDDQASA